MTRSLQPLSRRKAVSSTTVVVGLLALIIFFSWDWELLSTVLSLPTLTGGDILVKLENAEPMTDSAFRGDAGDDVQLKNEGIVIPGKELPDAVNSATASVFQNKKIRDFDGIRLQDFKPKRRDNFALMSSGNVNSSAIPRNDVGSVCRSRKWGVVTTIFYPTDAIVRFLSLDWCLVIVPDLKTPKDYLAELRSLVFDGNDSTNKKQYVQKANLDRVFYLSVEEQEAWANDHSLFGSFVRSTPWNHFSRKNLGYLFAILHDAEFIFDFDDDNYIKLGDDGLVTDILQEESVKVSVAVVGGNAFNHHPMMGATVNNSWARGFPVNLVQENAAYGKVAFEEDVPLSRVGVIQFVADNNPDVDAIHRITKPLPMNFESNSAVLVPKHSYAPFNAQSTIHSKFAFWGLLLPATVTGRVSDIWRSYFAECIFADTELRLVFAPPKIEHFRNEHNYLGDLNAEHDLYDKAGELITYLSSWSSSETNIAQRFEHLYIDLYEHGYVELEDVESVQFWLGALTEAGYQFPSFKGRHRNVAVMGQFNYADRESIITEVIFWAQKTREFFSSVVVSGPFNDSQVQMLRRNSIAVRSSTADAGFYSPLSNLRNLLIEFKNSTTIEGVLYIHDDAIMNVTRVANNTYPFPTHHILSNLEYEYESPPRLNISISSRIFGPHWRNANKCQQYRIFPDNHFESIDKSKIFQSFEEWDEWSGCSWYHSGKDYCSGGQLRMATDPSPSLDKLREPDGSILFTGFGQSDFMFVPIFLADSFEEAAAPHLKHGVFIECAFPKVLDHLIQRAQAQHLHIPLCTSWGASRGTMRMVESCIDKPHPSGIMHPYKISNGLDTYSRVYDSMQSQYD